MSNFSCNYCKKSYSSLSALNYHQKSAKFCLDIQKKNNQNETNENFICEYCNKTFTVKVNFKAHTSVCKIKKDTEKSDNLNGYNERINMLENEILELKNCNIKLTIELNLQKELNDKLIKDSEKFTKELINRPTTIYHDNRNQQSNSEYNIQFNEMVKNLVPFTQENIKQRIKNIKPSSIIYENNYKIPYNIAASIAFQLKDTVFTTDISRSILYNKDENGNANRLVANQYILECIKLTKRECIEMCLESINIVKNREKEFTTEDFCKCLVYLTEALDDIKSGKSSDLIVKIANILVKTCPNLEKKKIKNQLNSITSEEENEPTIESNIPN